MPQGNISQDATQIANNGNTGYSTSATQIKYRTINNGSPLTHDTVDANFEIFRKAINGLVSDISAINVDIDGVVDKDLTTDLSGATLSFTTNSGSRNYGIRKSGTNLYVNVPWVDTNTTYSAGNGISLSGTTFTVGAGGGLTQTSSGLAHADTSSRSSVNNSGRTYIQDITLDGYGHVTGINSATESYTYSLPTASSSTLGGIKVGSGLSISSGVLSANVQSIPTASSTVLGGIKVGSGLSISSGVLSANSQTITFAKDSGGYQEIFDSTSGLLITNRSKRVVCYINASTGVSSVPSTIGAYSIYAGGGAIQIDTKFANMATLLGYLGKYHNVGDQQWIIFAETDFTDSALHTDSLYNQSFAGFTMGSLPTGTVRKWTINNLQGEGIFSNRGPIRLRDMHFKVNSQVGNVSHLFSSYTNGFVLLEGKIAVELATGVYFYNGIFGATEATAVYNFASNFEIKNDISGNNAQALYHVNTGGVSHAPETIFSGKFHTCRFLQGGFFRFEHAANFPGTTASNRGPFIMESNYSLPSTYVSAALPAFIFEGGQSQVLHGNQPVATDVMRYTTLLGQSERFDRHVLTTSGATLSHTGVEPFERNLIMYPHGNYGTVTSHTNYRGWVFWGVTASNQLPAKKAFTII